MGIKTDILTSPNELLIKARSINWMPRGGDRFSVKSLLSYPAVWIGLSLLSISSIIVNPAPANLSHNLKQFILGVPLKQQTEQAKQTEYSIPSELIKKKLIKISEIWSFQPSIEETIFKNFSSEEKAAMEAEILNQIDLYKKANDNLRTERVLDWADTTIEPILDLDVPAEERAFWREVLPAIVYVESEGKSTAKSEADALGLAQLTEKTAEDVAKKHGIFNYKPEIGWDNLRLSLFYLKDLAKRYGNNLFLGAYYMGPGNMDQKILTALKNSGVNDKDSIMEKGISSNEQLRLYLDHYRINTANLGSSDAKEYLKKVAAARRILAEDKKLVNFQKTKG